MSNLFLASTFADSVGYFPYTPGKVLFIANPADPFKNKDWVNKDRKAFTKNDFEVTDLDLRKIDSIELYEQIKLHKIIHICGGSALYVLKLLKDKGMDKVIIHAVEHDEIIYTGTSAGTMICSTDISFCADDEDEQEAGMVGKLKDFKALNFIPYYVMCHTQEKYYVPSTKKAMDRLPKYKYPIMFLRDGMALIVHGKEVELV